MNTLPATTKDKRLKLLMSTALELAGFNEDDLRKAMQRTREALDAEEVTITNKGKIVKSPRHNIRLEASKEIFKMADAYPKKVETEGGGSALVVEVVTLAADGSKTTVRVGAKSTSQTSNGGHD